MKNLLDRLAEFRKLEPVRFDSYIRRGVMALAAVAGLALDVETAGFIVALVVYLVWGALATEEVRSRVTPVEKASGDEAP